MNRDYPLEKVRNFGIAAHVDAGKTTTSERVLYYTGAQHKIGEVHEGETTTDWMEQERERGITITAAAITCFWSKTNEPDKKDASKKYRFNVIDTPGHIDFTAEVKRSMRVLDGAVVVFDGVAGVEPQSETNWRYADEANVPRICFINKLDRTGASFEDSYKSIIDRLSKKAVRMQLPIGSESNFEGVVDLLEMKSYRFEGKMGDDIIAGEIPADMLEEAQMRRAELVERIVEHDEEQMAAFFEGNEPSIDELKKTLRKAVIANEIFPVYTGSALKNKGVQLVLDAVVDYLPSPLDLPVVKGINPKTGEEVTRTASDSEPFTALAFKLQTDPFVGALTFFRVYSGSVTAGSYVYNANTGSKERVGRIVRLQADKREEVEQVFAGEIAAMVGLKDTKTSHTLCDENNPIILETIKFPEPVVSLRIEPATKADQEKMGLALRKLADEDPTFKVSTVEKGMRESLSRGILAGYPIVDVSVELYDGSYHDVDSSEIAYKIAASMAFQEAAQKAKPVILEPIMKVEVVVPEQFMGDVTGSLSGKRGAIESMEERGMNKVVNAKVPLSEMFGYTTTLRSMTEGRGSMTMEFDHYEVVPTNVANEIIASRK